MDPFTLIAFALIGTALFNTRNETRNLARKATGKTSKSKTRPAGRSKGKRSSGKATGPGFGAAFLDSSGIREVPTALGDLTGAATKGTAVLTGRAARGAVRPVGLLARFTGRKVEKAAAARWERRREAVLTLPDPADPTGDEELVLIEPKPINTDPPVTPIPDPTAAPVTPAPTPAPVSTPASKGTTVSNITEILDELPTNDAELYAQMAAISKAIAELSSVVSEYGQAMLERYNMPAAIFGPLNVLADQLVDAATTGGMVVSNFRTVYEGVIELVEAGITIPGDGTSFFTGEDPTG